ncbi:DNA polymerase IV [bacterium]|nr:DNA polymerase IV [bacterium]
MRAILHIDMDAFFASVEVLDRPELRGRPVIVGDTPEGRGVVAAASYEARRFGVHSAMSAAQARRLCPGGVFIRPRHRRYSEISKKIVTIFRDYTPLVETISLDEAFLDVTASQKLFGTAVEIGRAIKKRIKDEIGLTASVGVAPNKFLAKIASDLEKPNGFVVIEPGTEAARLATLNVNRLWGVGPVMDRELGRLGIRLVGDILKTDPKRLERRFGMESARALIDLARGLDDRPVVPDSAPKSISEETTFERDIGDSARLVEILDGLADEVARRMRRQGYRARTVHLKARYPDFTTPTRSLTLPSPTASTVAIRKAARELFEQKLGRAGRALRLIGVGVSGLVPEDEGQLELFREGDDRAEKIDHLIDRIQKKHGDDSIRRG